MYSGIFLYGYTYACSVLIKQMCNIYLVQEENELHERLAELQRKERFLMSRGRDQIKPPEQGAHTCTCIASY